MNQSGRILRVLSFCALSLCAHAAGASNDSERLSRDIAQRTEQVLAEINERLQQRIVRDLTGRLTVAGEQRLRPAARQLEGRARATVSLEP